MKVAIIGSGPSGLVTLKYLATAHHCFPIEPIELICVEQEHELGGTFKYRVYEDAEVSFPIIPIPDTPEERENVKEDKEEQKMEYPWKEPISDAFLFLLFIIARLVQVPDRVLGPPLRVRTP